MHSKLGPLGGRSGLRPLIGFRKHQEGTTPSSTSDSDPSSRKSDLGPEAALVIALLRPTRHQPSSNDCMTMNRSPMQVRRSSSGNKGVKSWYATRAWLGVWEDAVDDVVERADRRLPMSDRGEGKMDERKKGREGRVGITIEDRMDVRRTVLDSLWCRMVSLRVAGAVRARAFSGRTISEVIFRREKVVLGKSLDEGCFSEVCSPPLVDP